MKPTAESTEEKAAADSTESSPETEASETTEPTPPGPKEKGAEKKDDKKAKKPAKKEKKDNTLRRTLTVATNLDAVSPPIWSPELILEAKTRLKALDLADTSRKEKAAALNDLEAYVYKVRNRLRDEEDQLAVISTSEEREEAIELCNAVEDWLYDEGKNQELSAYKSKQSSIKSKAEAIFKVRIHSPPLSHSHLPACLPSQRFKEHTARPEAVKKATHQLSAVRQLIGEWELTMPHITTEEKEKLADVVTRVEAWLDDNVQAQAALTAFETPAFTSAEVMSQLKPLTLQLDKLLKKPKPAPPKVFDRPLSPLLPPSPS
jgi:hypothetical protein